MLQIETKVKFKGYCPVRGTATIKKIEKEKVDGIVDYFYHLKNIKIDEGEISLITEKNGNIVVNEFEIEELN